MKVDGLKNDKTVTDWLKRARTVDVWAEKFKSESHKKFKNVSNMCQALQSIT